MVHHSAQEIVQIPRHSIVHLAEIVKSKVGKPFDSLDL